MSFSPLEQALKKSEASFKALAENAPALIIQIDKDGQLEYINKVVPPYKLEDVIGTSIYNYIDPSNTKLYQNNIKEVLSTNESVVFEFQGLGANGTICWYQTRMAPIIADNSSQAESVVVISVDITEKKEAEVELQNSLRQKELLLKEVHHRVKNNLQLLSSIFNLHISESEEQKITDVLEGCRDNIHSLSLINNILYRADDITQIDFSEYVNQICNYYESTSEQSKVTFDKKLEKAIIPVKIAVSCGLIVNELLTNALKHAFTATQTKKIFVSVSSVNDSIELIVSDNGTGAKPSNKESFGMELIRELAKQMNGIVSYDYTNGTAFKLSFIPV